MAASRIEWDFSRSQARGRHCRRSQGSLLQVEAGQKVSLGSSKRTNGLEGQKQSWPSVPFHLPRVRTVCSSAVFSDKPESHPLLHAATRPPFLPGPVGPCLPSPPSETYVMLQPQYLHSLHPHFYQVPCVGSSLVIPHCLHSLSHIESCSPYSRYQQFTYTKEITNPGLQPQVLGMGLVLSSHTWSLTWDLCASQSHQSL